MKRATVIVSAWLSHMKISQVTDVVTSVTIESLESVQLSYSQTQRQQLILLLPYMCNHWLKMFLPWIVC